MSAPSRPAESSADRLNLLRLSILERLHLAFHHELRGRLNGAGLQLSLLEKLSRGDLNHRPGLMAKAGNWVTATRDELQALQSWGEMILSLTGPSASENELETLDLGELLVELAPWLEAQGRRRGVPVRVETPEGIFPVSGGDSRWAVLDLITACVAGASDEVRISLVSSNTDLHLVLVPWSTDLPPADSPSMEILESHGVTRNLTNGEFRVTFPPLAGSPERA